MHDFAKKKGYFLKPFTKIDLLSTSGSFVYVWRSALHGCEVKLFKRRGVRHVALKVDSRRK